jgi:hypothetical protein
MALLRVVGLDPSFRHWGVAKGHYQTDNQSLVLQHISVIEPAVPKGKQVRQNSKDLEAAHQMASTLLPHLTGAHAIFIEIPIGSQNANAMKGFGVCIGILGTLRALDIPFFELTPTEIKLVATNNKNASKKDMIDWATQAHMEVAWPTHKTKGVTRFANKAEHMADALAAIYAGVQSAPFKQLVQMRA